MGLVRCSTPAPHLSSQDNRIVDLDDTETGGVSFVAQTNAEGGDSTDSEAVSLIRYSTSAPDLTPL